MQITNKLNALLGQGLINKIVKEGQNLGVRTRDGKPELYFLRDEELLKDSKTK